MDSIVAKVWSTPKENYGVFSEVAAMNVEKQLCVTKFTNSMDFVKHIKDLREKWKLATEKGANIDDATFRNILIALLLES